MKTVPIFVCWILTLVAAVAAERPNLVYLLGDEPRLL